MAWGDFYLGDRVGIAKSFPDFPASVTNADALTAEVVSWVQKVSTVQDPWGEKSLPAFQLADRRTTSDLWTTLSKDFSVRHRPKNFNDIAEHELPRRTALPWRLDGFTGLKPSKQASLARQLH